MDATLAACLAAACVAGFIQGFSGFGSVLMALPMLLVVLEPRTAVPLVSMVALTINVVMVARLRSHVRREAMIALLVSSMPGMAAGAWLFDGAPDGLIEGLLGAVILYMVFRQRQGAGRPGPPPTIGWTVLAGFTSGTLGLLTGANGPPVIAWAARQPWSRDELRATLTFYFLITGFGIVGTQAMKGLLTGRVAGLFAWSLPALLAGLWAGFAACGRADERTFRRVVSILLGFIGLGLLWQAGKAALG